MTACPSDFSLDDLEIHSPPGAASALNGHLRSCPRCASRVAERTALRDEFQAGPARAIWSAVRRAAPARRRWLRLALPLTLAGVTGLALATGLRGRGGTYSATKGALELEVLGRRDGRTYHLQAGHALQPGDELRFRPRGAPASARFAVLGSVDGTGRFSPFYPAHLEDPSVTLPGAGDPLPGGITIDTAPGPERILIVLSHVPLPARAVAAAAEAWADRGGFPAALEGVPVTSRWLVLPKQGLQ